MNTNRTGFAWICGVLLLALQAQLSVSFAVGSIGTENANIPVDQRTLSISFAGSYNGVWIGTETANIPGVGAVIEESFTIIYQSEADSLHVARIDFERPDHVTSMLLVKQRERWILPQAITGTVFGVDVTVTNFYIEFPSANHLTGSYTFRFSYDGVPYIGVVSLNHNKQSCTALGSAGARVANLFGSEGSLRCYEFQLPSCATDYLVRTSGGSGDVDLHLAYGQPDFGYFASTEANNDETLVPSIEAGTWFIGLEGFENYSGVTLEVHFNIPDWDNDGVGDCVDNDDDNDGVPDISDAFPLDANESVDTDGDGIGNNADSDDDDDGIPDSWEQANGLDPYRDDAAIDSDGDGYANFEEYEAGTHPNDKNDMPLPRGGVWRAVIPLLKQ